jgi:hypothetical protein
MQDRIQSHIRSNVVGYVASNPWRPGSWSSTRFPASSIVTRPQSWIRVRPAAKLRPR